MVSAAFLSHRGRFHNAFLLYPWLYSQKDMAKAAKFFCFLRKELDFLLQTYLYQLSVFNGSLPCLTFSLIPFHKLEAYWKGQGACPEVTILFITFSTRFLKNFLFIWALDIVPLSSAPFLLKLYLIYFSLSSFLLFVTDVYKSVQ